MAHSFRHTGGSLPLTLALDQVSVEHACPTCERLELDGVVRITAAAELQSGTTPASCTRGHLVMVAWTRAGSSEDPPTDSEGHSAGA